MNRHCVCIFSKEIKRLCFSISKTHPDHHFKSNIFVTIKKHTFESEAKNPAIYLETRYECFIKWKDFNQTLQKTVSLLVKLRFHINLRNNWARADIDIPAIVKTTITKTPSHTIIRVIHASSAINLAIKKAPPKKEKF